VLNSDRLLLHFPFDEGAGPKVGDVSGQGHSAVLATVPSAWIAGPVGAAVDLTVAGPLVVSSSATLTSPRAAITVSTWVPVG
jgi:hypothetical protein